MPYTRYFPENKPVKIEKLFKVAKLYGIMSVDIIPPGWA